MRTAFLIFLFLALFLTVGNPAAADDSGIIKGKVQTEDGQALPGVTVTLTSEEALDLIKIVVTDDNGGFVLNELPTGGYFTLKFNMEGFLDRKLYEPLSPGQTLTLSVTLEVDPGPFKYSEPADRTPQ